MREEHPASTCLAQDLLLKQHNEERYWGLPEPSAPRPRPLRSLTAAPQSPAGNGAVGADSRRRFTACFYAVILSLLRCSPGGGVSVLLQHRIVAVEESRSEYHFLCPGKCDREKVRL